MSGNFTDLNFNTTGDVNVISVPTGPNAIQISPTADHAAVDINTLVADLANGDVLLTTNVAVNSGEAGDIVVNDPFNWTNGTTLTLEAAGSILFGLNAGIAAQNGATLALEARGGSIVQPAQ